MSRSDLPTDEVSSPLPAWLIDGGRDPKATAVLDARASVVTSTPPPEAIRSPIQSCLERLHERFLGEQGGAVADYIPELAKADPDWFGICVATTEGNVYEVGHSRQTFTIQSISKPFTYGLALEDHGLEAVLSKIGVEPSGEAFNAISLSPDTGRPFNPMINAGAIAAAGLVLGDSAEDKLGRLVGMMSLYAGRPLDVDMDVYLSEKETGHRNRAIGHMLRNFGILTEDPEGALDLYFRQCSIAVSCRDLSLMAATLANGGVNPVTGERAVREPTVAHVLSLMTTCGMYDYAGEWVYRVGLPAKSGVGGGILAVLPGQLGIGVFSPRLDVHGNSVRGVAVCKDLSHELGMHFLRVARSSRSALRGCYHLGSVRSKRRRSAEDRALLDQLGRRARVYELQGDLVFSALEAVVRRVVDDGPGLGLAILDVRRVSRIDHAATYTLLDLARNMAGTGRPLVFAGVRKHARFLRTLEEEMARVDPVVRSREFADLDAALEWAEERLLRAARTAPPTAGSMAAEDVELLQGLDGEQLRTLESVLERRSFGRGEFIVRVGEPAEAMYMVVRGQVSVVVALATGQLKRLATLAPGMAFGEISIVSRSVRSADVRADEAVECLVLTADAFEALGEGHPAIKLVLLENMLRQAYDTVSRLTGELTALDA